MSQFFVPYLTYENTLEAAKYYEDVFSGEIGYIMYGKEMPDCPEDQLDSILHLELEVNGNLLYFADGDAKPSDQNILLLAYKDLDEMKESFDKMKEAGEVIRELEDTFWGAVFGMIEDKYGVKWEFHYMKPNE